MGETKNVKFDQCMKPAASRLDTLALYVMRSAEESVTNQIKDSDESGPFCRKTSPKSTGWMCSRKTCKSLMSLPRTPWIAQNGEELPKDK